MRTSYSPIRHRKLSVFFFVFKPVQAAPLSASCPVYTTACVLASLAKKGPHLGRRLLLEDRRVDHPKAGSSCPGDSGFSLQDPRVPGRVPSIVSGDFPTSIESPKCVLCTTRISQQPSRANVAQRLRGVVKLLCECRTGQSGVCLSF